MYLIRYINIGPWLKRSDARRRLLSNPNFCAAFSGKEYLIFSAVCFVHFVCRGILTVQKKCRIPSSPRFYVSDMHMWDSSVDTATRYGPDGPGVESRWGEIFRTRLGRPEAYPTSYTMGVRPFPGVNWPTHPIQCRG
jgi:hypothetical protein